MAIIKWGCTFKDVKAQWGDKIVLDKACLNLELKDIPYIPLCGITGGGKTTAMHLMSSQKKPHAGDIKWIFPDGVEFEWSAEKPLTSDELTLLRCNYFGVAFQDSILLPHLKIQENFIYRLNMKPCKADINQDKINQVLEKVLVTDDEKSKKVEYWLNKFPHELSGGQRQRFSLAQAMIRDPYVLFADEPTGSLDHKARESVMQVLWSWVDEKKGERALIWITHHMEYPDDPDMKKVKERYYFTKEGVFEEQYYNNKINKWLKISPQDKALISKTQANTSNLQVNTPNPQADTPNLQVNTPNPQADTPNPQADTPNLQVNTPKTQANTPNLQADTPNLQADTPNPPRINIFLALTEWSRSFPYRNGQGESRLDFFWLIFLLFLAMSFTLVLIATKDGLTNNLMDVVLGYKDNYGVPIQTIVNYQNTDKLDDSTLNQFNDNLNIDLDKENKLSQKVLAFPYIEIATNDLLSLPYKTTDSHGFDGWVIKKKDPLLNNNKVNSNNASLTLKITLNERLFNRTFSCLKYIEAISPYLLKADMPLFDKTKKTPKESCLKNNQLWLKITFNGTQQLVPFDIYWYQPRFPISKPISYAISIPQYYQLNHFRGQHYIFNNFNDPNEKTWITDLTYIRETASKQLLNCLRPKAQTRTEKHLKMTAPTTLYFIKNCAEKANIPFYKDIRNHFAEDKNKPTHYLTIAAANQLGGVIFKQGLAQNQKPCYDKDYQCKRQQEIDIMAHKSNYNGVVFYVKDRTRVMDVIKKIKPNTEKNKNSKASLLVIYSAYENALIRFNFLAEMINLLVKIYHIIFIPLIVFFIAIQIGFIISHRQRFIAILMAQGMKFKDIFSLFSIQITLSLFMSIGLSVCFIEAITWYMQKEITIILNKEMYQDYITLSSNNFNLLPIHVVDYGFVILNFFIFCNGLLLFLLYFLTKDKETADIL